MTQQRHSAVASLAGKASGGRLGLAISGRLDATVGDLWPGVGRWLAERDVKSITLDASGLF